MPGGTATAGASPCGGSREGEGEEEEGAVGAVDAVGGGGGVPGTAPGPQRGRKGS